MGCVMFPVKRCQTFGPLSYHQTHLEFLPLKTNYNNISKRNLVLLFFKKSKVISWYLVQITFLPDESTGFIYLLFLVAFYDVQQEELEADLYGRINEHLAERERTRLF